MSHIRYFDEIQSLFPKALHTKSDFGSLRTFNLFAGKFIGILHRRFWFGGIFPKKKHVTIKIFQTIRFPRGKGLGGSSNINGMMYIRGNPKDFNRWASLTGDPAWSWDNVLPYFKKSEDYHGNYELGTYVINSECWRASYTVTKFAALQDPSTPAAGSFMWENSTLSPLWNRIFWALLRKRVTSMGILMLSVDKVLMRTYKRAFPFSEFEKLYV